MNGKFKIKRNFFRKEVCHADIFANYRGLEEIKPCSNRRNMSNDVEYTVQAGTIQEESRR